MDPYRRATRLDVRRLDHSSHEARLSLGLDYVFSGERYECRYRCCQHLHHGSLGLETAVDTAYMAKLMVDRRRRTTTIRMNQSHGKGQMCPGLVLVQRLFRSFVEICSTDGFWGSDLVCQSLVEPPGRYFVFFADSWLKFSYSGSVLCGLGPSGFAADCAAVAIEVLYVFWCLVDAAIMNLARLAE